MKRLFFLSILMSCAIAMVPGLLQAQVNCVLQPPMLRIDFGSNNQPVNPNLSDWENYERVYDYCPGDGHYAITDYTSGCHNNHWVTLTQDHTSGDNDGKMLVVNAAYQPGVFFLTDLKGLKPGSIYQLGVWLVNICKPEYECTSIRPNLRFTIETREGKELARFSTGELTPTGEATWLQYSARFTAPSNTPTVYLKITNKAEGGCGNDFAMDDITLSECIVPEPPAKQPVTKTVAKPAPATKPVVKAKPAQPAPAKKVVPVITKSQPADTPVVNRTMIRERPAIPLPKVILNRANPVIKQIETLASDVVIDLYDNGEIDGDTVSIYHNNVLLVSKAGLSAKPVTIKLKVDATHPHHELVMVADNLGSIPPNTSLMILTAKGKRYEVFISSSEQKNAKIVIDLKNP